MTHRPPLIVTPLIFFVFSPAHASPATQQWFASELEAVVAAADQYNPESIREDREYMGAILRRGDRYSFTVGAGHAGRDTVTVRIAIPNGTELIAFWHTHGARMQSNRYFSAVDTRLVKTWQIPFYLADYTGQLKVMQPDDRTISASRARYLGLPSRAGFAAGQIVNAVNGEPIRIETDN